MISARHLKDRLHQLLRLAEDDGIAFKMHYKGKVFLLSFEPTGEIYKKPKRKSPSTKKGKLDLYLRDCDVCDAITVAGRCIVESCPSNTGKSHNTAQGVILRPTTVYRGKALKSRAPVSVK